MITWLNDSISGNDVRRNLTLYRLNSTTLQVDAQLNIANGFLREFAVSTLSDGDSTGIVMSFVVVPASVTSSAGG